MVEQHSHVHVGQRRWPQPALRVNEGPEFSGGLSGRWQLVGPNPIVSTTAAPLLRYLAAHTNARAALSGHAHGVGVEPLRTESR